MDTISAFHCLETTQRKVLTRSAGTVVLEMDAYIEALFLELERAANDLQREAEQARRNARRVATYHLKRAALLYAHIHRCAEARTLVIHAGAIHVCA